MGRGVYDLSKTYNDTGSPDITQPSASPDGGEAGYNKLKDKVPNLPSWSDLSSGIKLPNVPKPPSGTLDAQGYNDALDAWTYDEYMKQYAALQKAAADKADPIEKERLKYSPGGFEGEQKTYEVDGNLAEPPGHTDAKNVIVYIDGVMQEPTTNYTMSGTTITTAGEAAHTGARIVVMHGFAD